MGLDTTGLLLEGVRLATGNNAFTYPPRSVASGSISGSDRAEYMVFVSGQASGTAGLDIGDPDLIFKWSRNDSVTRFDYDSFARRWSTLPGGSPELLGVIGNSPRLKAPLIVSGATSPYQIYAGSPVRAKTFTVAEVATSVEFVDVPAGTVQISKETGELNFSSVDLDDPLMQGQSIYASRQTFFDRQKTKGKIGNLPKSSFESYALFLNPIPGAGETPVIRIGYRPPLAVSIFATESSIITPSAGSCSVSIDTGRVVFSPDDITSFAGDSVYYSGTILGESSLVRYRIDGILPSDSRISATLVGLNDPTRYVFFVEPPSSPATTPRFYLEPKITTDTSPASGSVYIDPSTGRVTVSGDDIALGVNTLYFVDTWVNIERNLCLQVFPSGVNTSGYVQTPDFVESYAVTSQLLQDGISASPFILLPTVPVDDSALKFNVQQGAGGGGTFTGDLSDGTDPTKPGLGYLLDLDQKQMKFCNRKSVSITMDKSLPSVKLPDAAISEDGIVISKNGATIQPGTGFDFTSATGLIEFIEPVGENDISNKLSISGTCVSPNEFLSNKPVFTVGDVGKLIFVASGPNVGFYSIAAFANPSRIFIASFWKSFGPEIVDVRSMREIIADRFWIDLTHSLRKFTVSKPDAVGGGKYVKLTESDFSVVPGTGQVNLTKPASLGDVFKIEYTSLDSQDEGVTVTPTARTEYASFKVRQEAASVTPGQAAVKFNTSHNTIVTDIPLKVYVNGVTQDTNSFVYSAPDNIVLGSPLKQGDVVTVDYWVHESPGGNRGFKLLFSPVDVDYPQIIGLDGASSAAPTVFNGDKRSTVQEGGAILVNDKDVLIIGTVSYDPVADTTSVTFNPPAALSVSNPSLKVCAPITGSYLVSETAAISALPKGYNSFEVQGNRPYKPSMIILLDGDPYYVIAATYSAATDKTTIVTAANASRNYIIPSLSRTVRPVFDAGSSFTTSKPSHSGYPVTLVQEGATSKVLRPVADYTILEGGVFNLEKGLGFGDTLSAMYVARSAQPAGTVIQANYAYAISPDQTNGLASQKLYGSYNLYSPDTFFFRVETVQSFIPEFVEELKKSASTGSGPNTADRKGMQTKDMGTPSLYFNEQHQANFDIIVQRLLKFYNDIVNLYEDLLSNADGRVPGGASGKFRYDGNLNNPVRANYASITNDIDDQVKLYDSIEMTGFFTYSSVPVYAHMYEPNNLSRIFPTYERVTVFLNDKVTLADLGKTMGSIGVPNLTSVGIFSTTAARSSFIIGPLTNQVILPSNGDAPNLVPQFSVSEAVLLYHQDGTPAGSAHVTAVSGSTLTLDTNLVFERGFIVADVANSSPKYYTPGRDLTINYDNGQVINFTLPSPFNSKQEAIAGNELVDSDIVFSNSSTAPKRIPVLDGSSFDDSGRYPDLPARYLNESDLLYTESELLSTAGVGTVALDLITVSGYSQPVTVGQIVTFINGPNAGYQSAVATVTTVGGFTDHFTVVTPFASADPTGSLLHFHELTSVTESGTLNSLVSVLSTGTSSPPTTGIIGTLDSELTTIQSIVESYGTTIFSGTGTPSGSLFTVADDLINTSTPATKSCLLFIPSGPNFGLYKVAGVDTHAVNVDPTAPFSSFVSSTPSPYMLIQPFSFLTSNQFKVLADFLTSTQQFLSETLAWQSAPTATTLPIRQLQVASRQSKLTALIQSLQDSLAKSDKLYDQRYLWIKQRTDKKEGTLMLQQQAISKRLEDTSKLIADQQKLLVANHLT